MAVMAELSDRIILDVFGSKINIVCDAYYLMRKLLVYYKDNLLVFYNIEERKIIETIDLFDKITSIKISQDEEIVAALNIKNELSVFKNRRRDCTILNVVVYDITDDIVCYIANKKLFYQKIGVKRSLHGIRQKILNFFVISDFCILFSKGTEESELNKVYKISERECTVIGEFEHIENVSAKLNKFRTHALFLVSTIKDSNSYYANTVLYLYDIKLNKFTKLPHVFKIHDFCFTTKGFTVCYGDQPSTVILFDLSGKVIGKYPKGLRNVIKYNPHENLVIFAGFGQLPGDVEVYDTSTKEITAQVSELGASIIEWNTCGTYFFVSTTNYFKEDNRIDKYDYYGRKVDSVKFKSLVKSKVYGNREDFIKLEKPEDSMKEDSGLYVPPCINQNFARNNITKTKKPAPKKNIPEIDTEETLKSKLEKIEELKKKMESGAELKPFELNLLLKEEKIKNNLNEMLSKNKSS